MSDDFEYTEPGFRELTYGEIQDLDGSDFWQYMKDWGEFLERKGRAGAKAYKEKHPEKSRPSSGATGA